MYKYMNVHVCVCVCVNLRASASTLLICMKLDPPYSRERLVAGKIVSSLNNPLNHLLVESLAMEQNLSSPEA